MKPAEVATRPRGLRCSAARRLFLQATLLALAVTMAGIEGRAQVSAPRFDVTNYNITAELFPSTHLLSAKAQIDLVPQSDLTVLNFQLHSNLRVDKVLDNTGKEAAFRQEGISLTVSLVNPLPEGQPASITVSYGGALATAEGSAVEGPQRTLRGTGSVLLV